MLWKIKIEHSQWIWTYNRGVNPFVKDHGHLNLVTQRRFAYLFLFYIATTLAFSIWLPILFPSIWIDEDKNRKNPTGTWIGYQRTRKGEGGGHLNLGRQRRKWKNMLFFCSFPIWHGNYSCFQRMIKHSFPFGLIHPCYPTQTPVTSISKCKIISPRSHVRNHFQLKIFSKKMINVVNKLIRMVT